eukprot:4117281-Amphidinium_carterae.1
MGGEETAASIETSNRFCNLLTVAGEGIPSTPSFNCYKYGAGEFQTALCGALRMLLRSRALEHEHRGHPWGKQTSKLKKQQRTPRTAIEPSRSTHMISLEALHDKL